VTGIVPGDTDYGQTMASRASSLRSTWNPSLHTSWRLFPVSNGSRGTANLPIFLESQGRTSAEVLALLPREEARSQTGGLSADPKRFRDPRLIYELSGLLWEDRTTHVVHLTDLGNTCRRWIGGLTLGNYTLLARHAVLALSAMELRNPTEEGENYQHTMEVFPALFVWEAMLELGCRISSEEMNRAVMNVKTHDDLRDAIRRVREARNSGNKADLGKAVVPDGPAQNDRIIPWMSLVSFGWLLMKDKRESESGDYELRPECIRMVEYACGLPRRLMNTTSIDRYVQRISDAACLPPSTL
jgi:hypothetical protein